MKSSGKRNADLSRISEDLGNIFVQSDLCIAILFNKLWNVVVKSFAGDY